MHKTVIFLISILLILSIIPISKPHKIILISIIIILWHKTIIITKNILEIVCIHIPTGHAQYKYKKIVNNIFKENFNFKHNFLHLPNKPTIFIATYPTSSLEYLAPALMPIPVCFIASKRAKKIMSKVYTKHECEYLPDGKNRYHMTKKLIDEKLKFIPVFMYVEDQSRRYGRNVGNLRKGAFWIAKELGATITPVVLDNVVEKWGRIPRQNYEVYIGPTINVSDPLDTLVKVRTMMRNKKNLFIKRKFII
jgi:hypothetical protein